MSLCHLRSPLCSATTHSRPSSSNSTLWSRSSAQNRPRTFFRNHYHGSQHHLGNHRRNQDLWLVKGFWAFFKFTTGSKCNLTSPLLLTTPILDRTSLELEVLIDAIIHHLGPLNSFNPLLCHKSVIIITVIVIVFRMRWVVIWHSIELI